MAAPRAPVNDTADDIVLKVEHLVTRFATDTGTIRPVDDVSFTLRRGRTLAIVGESGCGKSVTALSLLRLIPQSNGKIESGRILFEGRDVLSFDKEELHAMRGNRIAMIFQEPMSALNPVYTVGRQIAEVFRLHQNKSRREAWDLAVAMLERVKIPDPQTRAASYPHQLSGGMRQRVMIAMALACNPAVLIADEPSTALDVTIQAQVLRLMRELQRDMGTAILFITHDLGVVAQIADDVAVMYAGRLIEQGTVQAIFKHPRHPYTQGLLAALPKLEDHRERRLSTIEGMVPPLSALPRGCRFIDRCPWAEEGCSVAQPDLLPMAGEHAVACYVAQREAREP